MAFEPNRYVVVVNVPGYMPECEPVECATWREALDALREALELTFETDPRDASESELVNVLSELDRLRYEAPRWLGVQLGPYVHTIERL